MFTHFPIFPSVTLSAHMATNLHALNHLVPHAPTLCALRPAQSCEALSGEH